MGEPREVSPRQFELLCACYSGDILADNKCKAIGFDGRLWTVTGTQSGGNGLRMATLHELVPIELYCGPVESYPCDADGVFYKGQGVTAAGKRYVMSGRRLEVVETPAEGGCEATAKEQMDLFQ